MKWRWWVRVSALPGESVGIALWDQARCLFSEEDGRAECTGGAGMCEGRRPTRTRSEPVVALCPGPPPAAEGSAKVWMGGSFSPPGGQKPRLWSRVAWGSLSLLAERKGTVSGVALVSRQWRWWAQRRGILRTAGGTHCPLPVYPVGSVSTFRVPCAWQMLCRVLVDQPDAVLSSEFTVQCRTWQGSWERARSWIFRLCGPQCLCCSYSALLSRCESSYSE